MDEQDQHGLITGTELGTPAEQFPMEDCSVTAKLLKTPIKGGILTLTNHELVLGEGFLGTQNVRRFPLRSFVRLDLLPSSSNRSVMLCFVWFDGQVTEVDGVGPIAAQRIQYVLEALRRPAIRRYVS
jgi:hypothetical protein